MRAKDSDGQRFSLSVSIGLELYFYPGKATSKAFFGMEYEANLFKNNNMLWPVPICHLLGAEGVGGVGECCPNSMKADCRQRYN